MTYYENEHNELIPCKITQVHKNGMFTVELLNGSKIYYCSGCYIVTIKD